MDKFVTLGSGADVDEGALAKFQVGTEKIAVANVAGVLYAFGDVCTHRGCSLAKGRLTGTRVTCPCHGSIFDITTGAVVTGPATLPVKAYAIRKESGELLVEIET